VEKMGLEEITDEKTKKVYLVYRNNYGAFLIRELTNKNGKIDVSHGFGGTTVFL
jgi:hypothetical protein